MVGDTARQASVPLPPQAAPAEEAVAVTASAPHAAVRALQAADLRPEHLAAVLVLCSECAATVQISKMKLQFLQAQVPFMAALCAACVISILPTLALWQMQNCGRRALTITQIGQRLHIAEEGYPLGLLLPVRCVRVAALSVACIAISLAFAWSLSHMNGTQSPCACGSSAACLCRCCGRAGGDHHIVSGSALPTVSPDSILHTETSSSVCIGKGDCTA